VIWNFLKSFQLQKEMEKQERAMQKWQFYQRYKNLSKGTGIFSGGSAGMMAQGIQLKVMKRLPIAVHLRTAWNLSPEICDEITNFVNLYVKDYVTYWFSTISPNEEFQNDCKFLMAELFGGMVSKILSIDSLQAITIGSKSIELTRLHLGWFREIFAQLSEQYPDYFDENESEIKCTSTKCSTNVTSSMKLAKRQELIAKMVQDSRFLHPACNSHVKTSKGETSEILYLRHVATQMLHKLQPQLGISAGSNIFVSIAFHFLRETMIFKCMKPLFEYTLPRYSNEVIISFLREFAEKNEADEEDHNDAEHYLEDESTSSLQEQQQFSRKKHTRRIPKIRVPSRFLYRATRRKELQEEEEIVNAIDIQESMASSSVQEAIVVPEEEDEHEDTFMGIELDDSQSDSDSKKKKNHLKNCDGSDKKMIFAGAIDRVKKLKVSKVIANHSKMKKDRIQNASIPSSSASIEQHLSGTSPSNHFGHIDDLKHMKTSLEHSFNASLTKVRRRLRNLSNSSAAHDTVTTTVSKPNAVQSFNQELMRFKKSALRLAIRKQTSEVGIENTSPTSMKLFPSSNIGSPTPTSASPKDPKIILQEKLVLALEKAVHNFIQMFQKRPEMRSSSRSRELHDLLASVEDILVLGLIRNKQITNLSVSVPPLESLQLSRSNSRQKVSISQSSPLSRCNSRTASTGSGGNSSDGKTVGSTSGQNSEFSNPVISIRRTLSSSDLKCDEEDNTRDAIVDEIDAEDEEEEHEMDYHTLMEEEEAKVLSDVLVGAADQWYTCYLSELRPETPFLNSHWNFIMCLPVCKESEIFYSARGIQWILVALENGTLWEYFTALHLNRSVTEKYYEEEIAVMRNSVLMERVLKILSPLNQVKVVLETHEALGRSPSPIRPSSPTSSGKQKKASNCITTLASFSSKSMRVVESIWEIERYIPIQGWIKSSDKRSNILPSSEWIWETDWTLEQLSQQNTEENIDEDDSLDFDSVWEYAMTFDDKFHLKEKKFDSLRRRKWIRKRRQLPPVLVVLPATELPPQKLRSTSIDSTLSTSSQGALEAPVVPEFNTSVLSRHRSLSGDANDPEKKRTERIHARIRSDSKEEVLKFFPSNAVGDLLQTKESSGEEEEQNDCCFCCMKLTSSKTKRRQCRSCHQFVCLKCRNHQAFLFYPPPLETSKKEHVCTNCYERLCSKYKLKLEAHVGKYFSSVNLPKSGGGSGGVSFDDLMNGSTPKFEVTIQGNEAHAAWNVLKTFHDFETLWKKLIEKAKKQEKKHLSHRKGVDYMEIKALTPLTSSSSYENQLQVLEIFLQQLMASDTLCQSSIVQKFLLLGTHCIVFSTSSLPSSYKSEYDQKDRISGVETCRDEVLSDGIDAMEGLKEGDFAATDSTTSGNGKWRKGRWIASNGNKSKVDKMKALKKLEVSLFAILSEIFEFDGIGLVRRNLFTMTQSFLKALLNTSHFRMLEKQYLSFTDTKKMSTMLYELRMLMFPNEPTTTSLSPINLPPEQMEHLRQESFDILMKSFPSKMVSIFGEVSCENAALKVHEFVQHEILMKNLAFSILDEILLHWYPDYMLFHHKQSNK
jgi:hypothetical protein